MMMEFWSVTEIYETLSGAPLPRETQVQLYNQLTEGAPLELLDGNGPAARRLEIALRKCRIKEAEGSDSHKIYYGLHLTFSSKPRGGEAPTQGVPVTEPQRALLDEIEQHVLTEKKAHQNRQCNRFRGRRQLPDNLARAMDALPANNGKHISIYHEGEKDGNPALYLVDCGTGGNSHLNVSCITFGTNEVLVDPATGQLVSGVRDMAAKEHHLQNRVPNELAHTLFEAQEARLEAAINPDLKGKDAPANDNLEVSR